MVDGGRQRLLHVLRVPSEPAPPPGDPDRIRTFRASPRYLRYRTVIWALKQIGALGALVFGYFILNVMRVRTGMPVNIMGIIEAFAWAGFIVQLPFSFAVLRLDFEMRWYMLSDRSLRIREGVLTVSEKTMAFANVQKISIEQNPIQRLFGIADVTVRTAGGGATPAGGNKNVQRGRSMHEAAFEGVEDADAIRNLIRDRIRRYRDAGLGDPDEERRPAQSTPPVRTTRPVAAAAFTQAPHEGAAFAPIAAARELLHEARLLRAAMQ